jgi:hypothetical protein
MSRLQAVTIASALVWAAVIFAVDSILGNAPGADNVLLVLGGGAAATIILLGSTLRRKEPTV